nr:type I-C CRISPR-associated endonuclease Cas1c [Bifidobacterium sp. 7101]
MLNTLFVTTEDAYLSLEQENVVVNEGDHVMGRIPLRALESILCFSYKGASPALLGKCNEFGVSFAFYSPQGKYYGSMLGEANRNVLLRRRQYHMADDDNEVCSIAASFVMGKIFNARQVLERATRDHALRINVPRVKKQSARLLAALQELDGCLTADSVRGVEGEAAKCYFYAFDDLILTNKDDFYFEQRSRRPPMDRMNALLSFIYVLLSGDCRSALQGVGLDPYVGFLHTDRPGRSSLALDLVEELRPVFADRLALSLVNTHMVKAGDFEIRENGGTYLNDKGRKQVLSAWQKRKNEQIMHPFLKEKVPWGLVPYVQALLLARYIRGDMDAYPPMFWK